MAHPGVDDKGKGDAGRVVDGIDGIDAGLFGVKARARDRVLVDDVSEDSVDDKTSKDGDQGV